MRPTERAACDTADGPVVTLLAYPIGESGGIAAFVRSLLATLRSEHDGDFPLLAPATPEAGQSTRRGQIGFAAKALLALLKARPQAIQNHESLPLLCTALLCKLLLLGGPRVVHTVHVDPAERKPWLKRALTGCLFASCDRVVVVSADTHRRLGNAALLLRCNVGVIYGAPPSVARPSADALAAFARSFGLETGPVFCQIMRFYYPLKVKGAEQLLQAFRRVRRFVPDAQLLLVGSGPLWEAFRAKYGLDTKTDGVTLTGFVEDPLVPMTLADVYCHISFQDALPVTVLEAMSLGKAVLASAVGGIPEVIEHDVSGVLTGVDVEDVSRDMLRLLHRPDDRSELGREAARRIGARLNWTRCAAQYAALYGVVSRTPRRGLEQVAPRFEHGAALEP